MSNEFNYDNQNLSGVGVTEHLVREGYVADPGMIHQPRTVTNPTLNLELSDTIGNTEINVPPSQRLPNFDKASTAIWEKTTPTGREFIGYDGLYRIEFLATYREESLAWKNNRITVESDAEFREQYSESGRTLYTLSKAKSDEKLLELNLNVDTLRTAYDEAEELTPYFTDLNHEIPVKISTYLMYNDLDKLEVETQAEEDRKLFTRDINNFVDYYFGGNLTGTDVGFYMDKGGRMRIGYDIFMAHRAKPLLDDLVEYGNDKDYAVGHFKSGTLQFVLNPRCWKALASKLGDISAMASRYNDSKVMPDTFKPSDYPKFEAIINIEDGSLISANDIFGGSTLVDEVNPPTEDTPNPDGKKPDAN